LDQHLEEVIEMTIELVEITEEKLEEAKDALN
jgi:hypothetical protein